MRLKMLVAASLVLLMTPSVAWAVSPTIIRMGDTQGQMDDNAPLPDQSEQLQTDSAIRHHQLQFHQAMGLATLGAMAVTTAFGIYSWNQAPGNILVSDTHIALGGLTTGLYLSTAALALTAPQGYQISEGGGWDSVTLHRDLAWLHAAGLASTVVTGLLFASGRLPDPVLHGVLGGTTLALMTASAGVIALDF